MNEVNQIVAVFIVRVFFGIVIFLQGYDKVFKLGINQVIKTFEYPLKAIKPLPHAILTAGVLYTSFVELIGGLLLIIGLVKHFTLYFIALDFIVASIGFGIMNPMWDMQHVFPRFLLLVALLIMPSQWDVISADHFITISNIKN